MAERISMENLFKSCGVDYTEMEQNSFVDVSDKGIFIPSFNIASNKEEKKKVLKLVRKQDVSTLMVYDADNMSFLVECTFAHKFLIKDDLGVWSWRPLTDFPKYPNAVITIQYRGGLEKRVIYKSGKESSPILDMEIEDNNNYFANGLLSHNTGGNALKFYSTIRLEVRKKENITKGEDNITGVISKVKVVKNKVAPPFKVTTIAIEFGKGINTMGSAIDLAVDKDIINKSGSWYSYKEERLGQGKDKVQQFFIDNPTIYNEIYSQLLNPDWNYAIERPEISATSSTEPTKRRSKKTSTVAEKETVEEEVPVEPEEETTEES